MRCGKNPCSFPLGLSFTPPLRYFPLSYRTRCTHAEVKQLFHTFTTHGTTTTSREVYIYINR